MKINTFLSVKDQKADIVNKSIPIEDIFEEIRSGGEYTTIIECMRLLGKGNKGYDTLKTIDLKSFRFNFTFDKYSKTENVISPTGLFFIDADKVEELDKNNPYIYAAWKSPSGIGHAILIKVEGLTRENFNPLYDTICKIVDIPYDKKATKYNQQTLISFDPNIYINNKSKELNITEINTYLSDNCTGVISSNREKRKDIRPNDTSSVVNFRFDNIDEYFTGEYLNEDYRLFEDKVFICKPNLSKDTEEGSRHMNMYYHVSQIAVLNSKTMNLGYLMSFSDSVNSGLNNPLPKKEARDIAISVFKQLEEGSLEIIYNLERRILFNPYKKFTRIEKMKMMNPLLGSIRLGKTTKEIYSIIEAWNFNLYGNISIRKVVKLSSKSESTIKRHWSSLKEFVEELNEIYGK